MNTKKLKSNLSLATIIGLATICSYVLIKHLDLVVAGLK